MVADHRDLSGERKVALPDADVKAVIATMSEPRHRETLIACAVYAGHADPEGAVHDALLVFWRRSGEFDPALAAAIVGRPLGGSAHGQSPNEDAGRRDEAAHRPWEFRVRGWLAQVIRWSRPRNTWRYVDVPDVVFDCPPGRRDTADESNSIDWIGAYIDALASFPVRTKNQRASLDVCRRSRRDGRSIAEVATEIADARGLLACTVRSGAARLDAQIIQALKSRLAAQAAA